MSVQMVFELKNQKGSQAIVHALEAYKIRLRANIERTQERLRSFEVEYEVDTDNFLANMSAEDLQGGDLEYVEWAGEADLLEGLRLELSELENVRYQLS